MTPSFDAAPLASPENGRESHAALLVFATCPSSLGVSGGYVDTVARAAGSSESAGFAGMLIYADNSLVDPWLVSQIVIQSTQTQCPLVAVQPVLMHPYCVAKMVATLGFLHHRRVFLNIIAGGFKNDLAAFDDSAAEDQRYERLIEYTQIVQRLLEGGTVTHSGRFYQAKGLRLSPRLSPELIPGILMSASSQAGWAAARKTGAIAIQYAEPPSKNEPTSTKEPGPNGIRIGIVTRPSQDEAWQVALARFPGDRKGELTRQMAQKVSDSVWHQRLSEIGRASANGGAPRPSDVYWLHPFENYQTNCPYLVGSYAEVAAELARYMALGNRTYILDFPVAEDEFEHTSKAFQIASQLTRKL
jgi:alkanesulfonate monooxygenase